MIAGIYNIGNIVVYKGINYNPFVPYDKNVINISPTGNRERWVSQKMFGFRLKKYEK
jgi:hypothetical protein